MAHLEIQYLTGDTTRRELSKRQPVSIGSHASNDVVVDDDEVESIHARIAWNKDAYEVAAAGVDGVEVNGAVVQRARLAGDETLRFGTVDILFRAGEAAGAPARGEGGRPSATPARNVEPAAGPREKRSPMSEPRGNVDWDALQRLAAEAQSSDAIEQADDGMDAPEEPSPAPAAAPQQRAVPPRAEPRTKAAEKPPADEEGAPLTGRMRAALRHSTVRPGEEDTLRSPLVLGLAGSVAALSLIGLVFYFMINRQTTEDAFNAGKELYDQGKYANAVTSLTDFLAINGRSDFATMAMIYRDRANIDRLVITAQDYAEGLEKLRAFINDFQDYEEFESQREFVAERARMIALEAALQAGRSRQAPLLKTSDEAVTIFTTYAAQDVKPKERIRQIESARRTSEAEILRSQTQISTAAAIDAALKKQDTIGAIAAWRNLVGRYDELRKDPKIAAALTRVLDAEQSRVQLETVAITPETQERALDVPQPLTFAFHARSSTDEVSGGRCVVALAKDCWYGVDTVTGEPVWRRPFGLGAPFYPLIDPASGAAVGFDTRTSELVKIDVNTGKLLWRTPLEDAATSAPLLAGGRLLLPTAAGRLYDVDFSDGSISRRVDFSQPISTPAPMPGGERIVVAGDQEVFYVLNLSSLECERVQYLGDGHASGSIKAPLLPMGPYILACENSGTGQSCDLHLLNAAQTSGELVETASASVQGLVVDPAVIRGQDLFVPSTGERISSFTVSDVAGQPALTVGPVYPGQALANAPIFLLTGPERQAWIAASAVRKLQVVGDDLRSNQTPAAVGIASQPMQYVDRMLFHGRRRPFTEAVTFVRMDREALSSDTQALLGGSILAWSVSDRTPPSITVATEGGVVFRTTPARWEEGGIQTTDAERLPLSEDLSEPIAATAMDRGQLAVAAGGAEPKLWVLNSVGKLDRSVPLTAGPQGPLGFLSGRVLVPMQGRLKLVSTLSGQPVVEDFTLPTEEMPTAHWRYVAVAGETDVVGVLDSGDVILARYQSTPRHYLGQINRISLGAPVHVRGDSADGMVAIADGDRRVHLLETSGLTSRGERQMEAAISNDVYLAGEWVFVETGGTELHCLARDQEMSTVWKLPLEGASLAGRPHRTSEGLVLAMRDGRVLIVNPADGAVTRTLQTGQSLAGECFEVAGALLAPTLDGSLVHLQGVQP